MQFVMLGYQTVTKRLILVITLRPSTNLTSTRGLPEVKIWKMFWSALFHNYGSLPIYDMTSI